MSSFNTIYFPCRVKTWANKLGFELSQLGKFVTNADKFNDSYKQAVLKPRDGNALVHEIAKDIKAMMESKISAIKVHVLKALCKKKSLKKILTIREMHIPHFKNIYKNIYSKLEKSILAFINLIILIYLLF